MPRTGRLMGAAEIAALLHVGETRVKHYLALPTWPPTYDELAMGRVWATEDVERWIQQHRPDLLEEPDTSE